jgi:hypothetical protein
VFVDKGMSPDGRHVYLKTPVIVDEAEGASWLPVSRGLTKGDKIVTAGAILLAGGLSAAVPEAPK